jgi:hypothetical protein
VPADNTARPAKLSPRRASALRAHDELAKPQEAGAPLLVLSPVAGTFPAADLSCTTLEQLPGGRPANSNGVSGVRVRPISTLKRVADSEIDTALRDLRDAMGADSATWRFHLLADRRRKYVGFAAVAKIYCADRVVPVTCSHEDLDTAKALLLRAILAETNKLRSDARGVEAASASLTPSQPEPPGQAELDLYTPVAAFSFIAIAVLILLARCGVGQ